MISPPKIINKLGEGSYGRVYRASYAGEIIAVKIVEEVQLNEIDIMSRFSHPNLVPSLGLKKFITKTVEGDMKSSLFLMMPYAESDLYDYVVKYEFANKKQLLRDIGKGISFLHANNIIHLDIKLNNCLVYCGRGVLADYGLAMYCKDKKYYPKDIVVEQYRAPEHFLSGEIRHMYSKKSDIWAYAITILKLFDCGTDNYENKLESDLVLVMKQMLEPDPNKRISIDEVLSFPYFQAPHIPSIFCLGKAPEFIKEVKVTKIDPCLERYIGFYNLIDICLRNSVLTETFFLAGDIYQRIELDKSENQRYEVPRVEVRKDETSKDEKVKEEDYKNLSETCFRMAYKMIEGNVEINQESELQIIESLEGILYKKNFFTLSRGGIKASFKCLRNAFIYQYIDLKALEKKSIVEYPIKFTDYHVIANDDLTAEVAYLKDKEDVISQ